LHRVLRSLYEFERSAQIDYAEWDEVHDFLDFLWMLLVRYYEDLHDPKGHLEEVEQAFEKLKAALENLDGMDTLQGQRDRAAEELSECE
jgi:hypothetical protein